MNKQEALKQIEEQRKLILKNPKKSKFRSLWRILLQNRKNWGIHCPTQ